MDYGQLVQTFIKKYQDAPVDIDGKGDGEREWRYLFSHKDSYSRTIRDVDGLWTGARGGKNILEIGPYLGLVSLALKDLGYGVSAVELPEFWRSPSLQALFNKNNVSYACANLRDRKLPYDSHSFDAVIICEVIEHLNFNPLPVLKEINRILKKGGYLYIGMPNQARIQNRLKLLMGRSINEPINNFLKRLVVSLHWREYTLAETAEMLESMGFAASKKYFFVERVYSNYGPLANLLARLAYVIPSFRPFQVAIGQKVSEAVFEFGPADANS
jgi:SAM-dependent methyltransferase